MSSTTTLLLSRIGFALFVWVAPALVAGALGWPSLWGSGSALGDYLLPLPLTGGVLHAPSFIVFLALVAAAKQWPERLYGLPVAAFVVCALALSLQLNLERINDILFTDLQTSNEMALRRDPLLLFVASDAFWLAIWAVCKRIRAPRLAWLAVPLVPALVLVASGLRYATAPAQFEAGAPSAGAIAGQQQQLVYTNIVFDEAALSAWLDQTPRNRPWWTPDAQHTAIHFVSSRQQVDNADFTGVRATGTIATICLYETDRSTQIHNGYFDCFAGHVTVAQRLNAALRNGPARVNRDYAQWHARLAICDGLALQKEPAEDIEHVDHCLGMRRTFAQDMLALKKRYGRTSREVRLAQALGKRVGFD